MAIDTTGHLRSLIFCSLVVHAFTLAASALAQDSAKQMAMDAVAKYESWCQGWSFEQTSTANAVRKTNWVSDDGMIRRVVIEQPTSAYADKNSIVHTGIFSNAREGWVFTTSAVRPTPAPTESSGYSAHRVAFSRDGQLAHAVSGLIGGLEFGIAYDRMFSEVVGSSDVRHFSRELGGSRFHVLECAAFERPLVTFYLDTDFFLRHVHVSLEEGDKFFGTRHSLPDSVGEGEKSVVAIGPIEYSTVGDESVVTSYTLSVDASDFESGRKINRSIDFQFGNFQEIGFKFRGAIDLPEFDLKDGQRVSCSERESLDFQLLEGRPTLMVDERSIAAAKRARFWQSKRGHHWFYVGLGIALCGFIGLFVWYRNR